MAQDNRQFATQGIILARTDFGEADRILTFLTPDHGKVKAVAKGVRRSKAKLAGAVELFSVSDITLIIGRGNMDTLISARLIRYYGNIVKDIGRTTAGYEFLRIANKATESRPERDYFELLNHSLSALDDLEVNIQLTELWFKMQLLKLAGHSPNLHTDGSGKKLEQSKAYGFDFDKMLFLPEEPLDTARGRRGGFGAAHIKFLRLGFGNNSPKALQRINNIGELVQDCQHLINTILKTYVRI